MLKANKQDAVLCDFAVETGFNLLGVNSPKLASLGKLSP
jgi:hypothetical protein